MKIVTYLDNDALNIPNVGDTTVYTLNAPSPISKEQLVKKYPRVFNEGVGKLEGEYHIRLDLAITPVQHTPRRVPVALRDRLKQTLHDNQAGHHCTCNETHTLDQLHGGSTQEKWGIDVLLGHVM